MELEAWFSLKLNSKLKEGAEPVPAPRSDATIPTPTVGYEGSVSSTNDYVVTNGIVGTPLKLVAPVREGHMFLGWYDNPECYGEKVTSVSTECTLYASWLSLSAPAPVHNINYDKQGLHVVGFG